MLGKQTACEKFCCEDISLIENFDKAILDENNLWVCHHRLETHTSDGERRLVDLYSRELKALNMYYDRPASELIFLEKLEHNKLHAKGRGDISKDSEVKTRNIATNKLYHWFTNGKENIRAKECPEGFWKGRVDAVNITEKSKKLLSKYFSEMHYYNNGKINVRAKECPEGFVEGMLKGTHYWNNGVVCIRSRECPEGFVQGRLLSKNCNSQLF